MDNIICIFLSAAFHHSSVSEQTFLVTLSASGSIKTRQYWKLDRGGGKEDLWSLAAGKINKYHIIRPISVSQWGLSSRKFKLTLFSFKEKNPGEGKRKEKCWWCWKSDRETGATSAGETTLIVTRLNTRVGMYVPYVQEQAQEWQKGSSRRDRNFLCATIPCSLNWLKIIALFFPSEFSQ